MAESADRLLSTGDAGLDQVLNGGLNRGRPYLLRGASGTGKTTLGLQFLRAGAMEGASCLFIALSESEADLRMIAASHGWSLEGVAVYDASSYIAARERSEQSLFDSDEVELDEIVERILAEVRERRPTLLVIDAVSEVFTLSKSAIRFRRQLYAFKMLFQELDCTALLIDSSPGRSGEESELNDLAHGVIEIESELLAYGRLRRVLHVSKYRARAYLSGRHDLRITEGEGMHVFPRTSASPGRPGSQAARGVVQSGLPELDTLLGDGILGGTSTLVVGPAGSGKSSLANLYAYTAAQRGEASVIYLFDESRETYLRRAEGLGIPMKAFCE
ncbi:MAG: ATPase domain-containing protein, partial [Verrucomicrobiota bacterium]